MRNARIIPHLLESHQEICINSDFNTLDHNDVQKFHFKPCFLMPKKMEMKSFGENRKAVTYELAKVSF